MIRQFVFSACALILILAYACGGGGQTEEEYNDSIQLIVEESGAVIVDMTDLIPRAIEDPGTTWYRRIDADIERLEELILELEAIDVPRDCEELHGLLEEWLELVLSLATMTRGIGDAPSVSKIDEASEASTEAVDLLKLSSQQPCANF